jgi:hypothetical protein
MNFANTALVAGDVSAMVESHANYIETIVSVEPVLIRAFTSSLSMQMSSFKASPTVSEEAIIKQNVQDTQTAGKAVITSQSGLANAFTNSIWKSKAINKAFYALFDESELQTLALIANPAVGFQMLSTKADEIAAKHARGPHLIQEFIERYRTGKSKCSINFAGKFV